MILNKEHTFATNNCPLIPYKMKKTVFILSLFVVAALAASAQQSYRMFEMMYMTVKSGHEKEFEKAVALHNKKFHSQAPYKVTLAEVELGPNSGDYTWVMGPLTFTDLDGRPADDAHESDWSATVMTHVEKVSGADYWRVDDKLSYSPLETATGERRMVTYYDIAPGKGYRFDELVKKLLKVYQDKKYKDNFTFLRNSFNTGNGRDVMIISFFDKFSYFDADNTMVKDYEEMYGQGSWSQFMTEYNEVVVSSTDEIRHRRAELSSSN